MMTYTYTDSAVEVYISTVSATIAQTTAYRQMLDRLFQGGSAAAAASGAALTLVSAGAVASAAGA